jgi:hypothetical protein
MDLIPGRSGSSYVEAGLLAGDAGGARSRALSCGAPRPTIWGGRGVRACLVDDLGATGTTRAGGAAEHIQWWRAPARWRHGSSGAFKATTEGHEDGGALIRLQCIYNF